jgi:F-type H+-transporting ATPase subunit b
MIIDTVLLLATEAKEAAKEGFGINPDILGTNLFNLAILLSLVVFYGKKVLGQILGERRSKIAEAIAEAETRKNSAATALAEEQKKLAQSKQEAEKIITNSRERAKVVATDIAAQADIDIQRMRETAAKDLTAEQDRVLVELRQRITALALANVESQLSGGLEESVQQTLIDRSLANLGGK